MVTRCNKRRNGYNTTLMNQKLHRSMQRKALFHQKYHRVRSIRKNILGLVFSSRLKSVGHIPHSSHIGRQSRPNLRDFTRKCEILRDSEKSRLCHFFRAMALKFAFYTTIRRKGRLLGTFCATEECH